MNAKRVLVIGGGGVVTRFLLPRLLQAGYRVRAIAPDAATAEVLDNQGAEPVIGDWTGPDPLDRPLRDCEVVVHAADRGWGWGPGRAHRAGTESACIASAVAIEKLVTAAQRVARIERWVQLSSTCVYRSRQHHGSDESAALWSPRKAGHARQMVESEVILGRYRDEWQFPAVILRSGFVYGPLEHPSSGGRPDPGAIHVSGRGHRRLDNTFAGNLADGILLAIANDRAVGEVFNIRDERLVTRREFVATVGRRPWFERLSTRKSRSVLHEQMSGELDFSIDKAKRVLGYQPAIDFREGICPPARDAAVELPPSP